MSNNFTAKLWTILVIIIVSNPLYSKGLHEFIGNSKTAFITAFGQPVKEGKAYITYINLAEQTTHVYFDPNSQIINKIETLIEKTNRKTLFEDFTAMHADLINNYGFEVLEGNMDEGWINYKKGDINIAMHRIVASDNSFYRLGLNIWKWETKELKEIEDIDSFVKSYFSAIEKNEIDKAVKFFVPSKRKLVRKTIQKIADETEYYKVLSSATVDGRLYWIDVKVELMQKKKADNVSEGWTVVMHLVRESEKDPWKIEYVK